MEEWAFVDDRELESFRGHKSCSTCGHFGFAVLGQCQVLGCCHLRQALLHSWLSPTEELQALDVLLSR